MTTFLQITSPGKCNPYTQLLEIRLNGHNFVSFEATISRFFMVTDDDDVDDYDHDHDDANDDHVD